MRAQRQERVKQGGVLKAKNAGTPAIGSHGSPDQIQTLANATSTKRMSYPAAPRHAGTQRGAYS